MPSGSRKRKSLKKPKSGEPASSVPGKIPELEPDFLEESMAKEMAEIDAEEPAEADVPDGTELLSEVSQREGGEAADVEELSAPDQGKAQADDPLGQTELQAPPPPFTASENEVVDSGWEMDPRTPDVAQGEPPFTGDKGEVSYGEITSSADPSHGAIKPGLEQDANLSDTPPMDIETGPDERRSTFFEAPQGNEQESDDFFANNKPMEDVASEDVRPSADTATNEITLPESEAVPAEFEQGEEVNRQLADVPAVDGGSGEEEKQSESCEPETDKEQVFFKSSIAEELLAQEDEGQDIVTPSAGDASPSIEGLPSEIDLGIGRDAEISKEPPIDEEAVPAEQGLAHPSDAQNGSELESDEISGREELRMGIAQEDLGPDNDSKSLDESVPDSEDSPGGVLQDAEPKVDLPDAPPVDIESTSEKGYSPFETQNSSQSELAKPLAEEELFAGVAQEDMMPDNVAGIDQSLEENPAAPGCAEVAAPGDGQPENMEAIDGKETEACPTSADNEPKGADVTHVETEDSLARDEPKFSDAIPDAQTEAVPEIDPIKESFPLDTEMGAAPVDAQAEIDKETVGVEMDTDSHLTSIEPEATNDADYETAVEIEEGLPGTQVGGDQETDQGQLGTDLQETGAKENEPEKILQQSDNLVDVETEQPAVPQKEFEIKASGGEIEGGTELTSNDVESEQVLITREGESETEASLEDFEGEADFSKGEVAEAETKPEVNATLVETQEDEGAEAFADPELEESASPEAASNIVLENSSMEAVPESEPERVANTALDVDAQTMPKSEQVEGEKMDEGNEVSVESSDISFSKDEMDGGAVCFGEAGMKPEEIAVQEIEPTHATEPVNEPFKVNDFKDIDQVDVSVSDVDKQRTPPPQIEPKADADVGEPDLQAEAPLDTELNQAGSLETELITQNEFAAGKDQQGDYQSGQKEREISVVEPSEVPVKEPEAEAEVSELGAKAEDLSDFKLDEKSPSELETGQQDCLRAELDQFNVQNSYQQDQKQERVTDPGAEAPEVSAIESNQEEDLPLAAATEAGPTESESDNFVPLKVSSGDTCKMPVEQEHDLDTHQTSAPLIDNHQMALPEGSHEAEVKGSQNAFDKWELGNDDARIIDEPSGEREVVEDSVSTTSPSKSEGVDEHEPKNRNVIEQGGSLDSPSEDVDRDIGEEEAAMSTAAEAGSAVTDFDENPSYQQFSADFTGSEQDVDVSESRESGEASGLEGKESNDLSSERPSDLTEIGSTEHEVGEHADNGGERAEEDSQKIGEDSKTAEGLEPNVRDEEGGPGMAEAEVPTTRMPDFSKVPTYVYTTEKSYAPKEVITKDAGCSDEHRQKAVAQDNGDMPKESFDTVQPKPSHLSGVPSDGGAPLNASSGPTPQVSSGQDMIDTQGSYQQTAREASLPMGVSVQNEKQRALDQGNLKGNERPGSEGALQRRRNLLGCCGMFDVLLGKN